LEGRPDLCNLWDFVHNFCPLRCQNIILQSVHPLRRQNRAMRWCQWPILITTTVTLLRQASQQPGALSFHSIGSNNGARGRYWQDTMTINNSFVTSSSLVSWELVMYASTLGNSRQSNGIPRQISWAEECAFCCAPITNDSLTRKLYSTRPIYSIDRESGGFCGWCILNDELSNREKDRVLSRKVFVCFHLSSEAYFLPFVRP